MCPRVVEFEDAFAGFVDAPSAVAVANGTAPQHLAPPSAAPTVSSHFLFSAQ